MGSFTADAFTTRYSETQLPNITFPPADALTAKSTSTSTVAIRSHMPSRDTGVVQHYLLLILRPLAKFRKKSYLYLDEKQFLVMQIYIRISPRRFVSITCLRSRGHGKHVTYGNKDCTYDCMVRR